MIMPVILAGGSGTRLWPLSRELHPKQILSLVDDRTMLQNTVLRLIDFQGMQNPLVICNQQHRFIVAEQLRAIGVKPAAIFLEPFGRNTAPAVAVAALQALAAKVDPILLVLPADHSIDSIDGFHDALTIGAHFARQGYLITFGVVPDRPETGYGYIRKGAPLEGPPLNAIDGALQAVQIDQFVEKPDLATAEGYVRSGQYCWNSGMFMFRASRLLAEMKRFAPDIAAHCRHAFEKGRRDLDFFRLDETAFDACPSDSIDYAVMEKTERGVMVPFQAGWNDLGSWEALWQVGAKDADGNVVTGDVVLDNVRNSYLYAGHRMVAATGLEDHVVVETADAVMVAPRAGIQGVKNIVNRLKAAQHQAVFVHKKVYRPWGSSELVSADDHYQVKRVRVKPGAALRRQKHFQRAEHWIILEGTALVTKGDTQFRLEENESTFIAPGILHALENPGSIPLDLIEVRSGKYLKEDDIERP